MANPALNDKTFAPERLRTLGVPVDARTGAAPASWADRMTLDGVVIRALILFPILLATGWVGWQSVDRTELGVELPGWLLPVLLGGLVLAVVTVFRPRVSPYTAPAYAAAEGLVLGAVSGLYEIRYEGIVLQAVMLTGAVFALMLAIYSKRIVTVDDRFRRGVMVATLAVAAVYLVSFVLRLFGADVAFIHEGSMLGILFSLVVVGIASANLLLDFDLVERGVAAGAPKWMEWYAVFGILVTLVWLYLELLRLLSKLRSR